MLNKKATCAPTNTSPKDTGFGVALARVVDVGNGPLKALEFTGAPATDGKPHVYREHVLIPPGADMHIVASGALTAPGLIQVTGGVNVSSAAITRIPGLDDAPKIVEVAVTAPSSPDQVRAQDGSATRTARWWRR